MLGSRVEFTIAAMALRISGVEKCMMQLRSAEERGCVSACRVSQGCTYSEVCDSLGLRAWGVLRS